MDLEFEYRYCKYYLRILYKKKGCIENVFLVNGNNYIPDQANNYFELTCESY